LLVKEEVEENAASRYNLFCVQFAFFLNKIKNKTKKKLFLSDYEVRVIDNKENKFQLAMCN
jgi:hypothetical protein